MNQDKFLSLDGLRAFACVGIMAKHVWAVITIKPSECFLFTNVVSFASNFVLLFMMISAFSMCCGYLHRFQQGSISLETFYKKRVVRILPFFALLTGIDLCKCLVENHFSFSNEVVGELWECFANVTLLFGLVPDHNISVVGVGWFLGTIFVFYLLFPFFSVLMKTKKRMWISLVISLIWVFAVENYFAPVKGTFAGKRNILMASPFFVSGGLLFLYKEQIFFFFRMKSARIVFAVLLVSYTIFFFMFPEYRFSHSNLIMYVMWIVFAMIDSKFYGETTLLKNKVVFFLNGISMELYLCHLMFFRIIEKIHLEKFVSNHDILYCLSLFLTIIASILFSLVYKKLEHRLKEKMHV